MKHNEQLKKNVKRNYLYTVLASLNFTNGVWMLYLASKGLSLFEIGIMEAIFHVTSFTMEVPTGLIADVYGRKTSRVLGRLLAVLSTVVMIFSNSVWMFGLSFVIQALSYNLESGAGDALIYDSLKETKMEGSYMKVKGTQEIFFQLSKTLALIFGGYIATLDYSLVYKGTLVIGVVALLQTLTFKEPTVGKVVTEEKGMAILAHQLKASVKAVKADKRIAFLIVLMEIFSCFYVTEFFYIQNLMKSLGQSEFQIGLVLAAGALFGALAASNAHKLEKKLTSIGLLTIFPIVAILGFWGMTFSGYEGIFFILLSLIEGGMFVATSDYINRLIPSEQRATILSFQSMVFSILMIVLFPIIGKLGDLYGLNTAFLLIAVVATLVLSLLLYVVLKDRDTWGEISPMKDVV